MAEDRNFVLDCLDTWSTSWQPSFEVAEDRNALLAEEADQPLPWQPSFEVAEDRNFGSPGLGGGRGRGVAAILRGG